MDLTMTSPERVSITTKPAGCADYVEVASRMPKTTANGLVLVPQPSDDPKDPLNWPTWKKLLNLGIIVATSFCGCLANVANAAGFGDQALLYDKSLLAISYSLSASVAGLAVGPLIWTPLGRKFGKCFVAFWATVLLLGTSIWGATCTGKGDYISFVLSRMMAGLAGSAASTVGAGLILETFFLHQRGKAFTVYSIVLLVGAIAGPTFSGFIVTYVSWTVQYWYNAGFEVVMIFLIALCLSETGFTRPGGPVYPPLPESWVRDRIATYIKGSVTPPQTWGQVLGVAGSQFTIMASPISLSVGSYLLVIFAWPVAVNTLLGVFLQTPVEFGGYGFTPLQNSYFLFTMWIAVAASQIYGHLVVDRLALFLCKRWGKGVWKPEYRLHALWVPGLVFMPIGLGLFGASLKNHYHPVVLALGTFGIISAAIAIVPVVDTYTVECFTSRGAEANAVMNLWRLSFGLAIPFFIGPWTKAVGIQWVFGSMAFFTILVFGLIITLMIKGHTIRGGTLRHLASDEEGTSLTIDSHDEGMVKA